MEIPWFLRGFIKRVPEPSLPKSQNFNKRGATATVEPSATGNHLDIDRKIWVQRKLRELGISSVNRDYRDFVPGVIAAIRTFQTARGLEVDGVVGPVTWAELVKAERGNIAPTVDGPAYYKHAQKDAGLQEIAGVKHHPRIVQMFEKAGHPEIKDDETAWCSAAMNCWMIESGIKGTGSLLARSWLAWGNATDKAAPGVVAVFKRGNSTWQGHVAFLTGRETGDLVEIFGGNQSNRVNTKWAYKSELLGLRVPKP